MGKKTIKPVKTFQQFLKEQKTKKNNNSLLKEGSITLKCEWWDEAIAEVMDDIEKEVNLLYSWDNLYKYIKTKDSILGRETSIFPEQAILLHIKELIFWHHGDSYFKEEDGWIDWSNTTLHRKAVIINELANIILQKVKEETKKLPDDQTRTATLVDKEPQIEDNIGLDDVNDDEDVLPF